MAGMRRNFINGRTLTTLMMLFSFLWLPPSGIALHFTEAGPFEPLRHMLMAFHNVSALIFLATVTLHLVLNCKPMSQHLVSKAAEYRGVRKEAAIAAVVVTSLIVLFAAHAFHVPR